VARHPLQVAPPLLTDQRHGRSGPGALPLAGRRVVGWTVFLEEVPPLSYPVIPQRGERLQASRDAEATVVA